MKSFLRLFVLFIFLCQSTYGQGNYNGENFGNRSILLSGSVTGSVDDLGLAYYNPARIALVENPVFSINARAYQVSSANFENVFGRNSEISDSKFEGVPSLIAGTFNIKKWEKHHFAYAFLSKQRSSFDLNVFRELDPEGIYSEIPELDRLVGDFNLNNKERDEWFGVTWGMKLRDNFSIGVSTFVSIYDYGGRYDLRFASSSEDSGVDLFNNEIVVGQSSYGIFWKVGLAWKFEKFDFGLNIDLPYLEVISTGNFRYQRYLSGVAPENEDFISFDFEDLEASRKEPLGISAGIGLPIGKHKLHFKVDWHAPLSEYDRLVIPTIDEDEDEERFAFKEEYRSVINFGLGGEFYINDHLNFYASFSTDFSPSASNANIFDLIEDEDRDANFDADYFHYGFGLDFKLKKVKLVVGATYSTASGAFGDPIDFPNPDYDVPVNDDPSQITVNRWRFILGLEIPIFGYDVEIK